MLKLHLGPVIHMSLAIHAADHQEWARKPGISEQTSRNFGYIADLLVLASAQRDLEFYHGTLVRNRDGDSDDTRYCRGRAAEIIDQYLTDLETTRAA